MRRDVEQMVACHVPHEQIAISIGCNRDTLYKYFDDNLKHGLARRRREIIELMFRSARKGNIGAQRKIMELVDTGMVAQDMLERVSEVLPKAATEPKLGKKERAVKDASEPDVSTPLGELMAMRQRGQPVN